MFSGLDGPNFVFYSGEEVRDVLEESLHEDEYIGLGAVVTAWFALDPVVTKHHTNTAASTVNNFRSINAQRQSITKSDNPPTSTRYVARKLNSKPWIDSVQAQLGFMLTDRFVEKIRMFIRKPPNDRRYNSGILTIVVGSP